MKGGHLKPDGTAVGIGITQRTNLGSAAVIVAALAWWFYAVLPVFAQDRAALPLVGVLRVNTADTVEPMATKFRTALAALGQVDGRNIRLETRLAEGHVERLPELARSLVRDKASVIVTAGEAATRGSTAGDEHDTDPRLGRRSCRLRADC